MKTITVIGSGYVGLDSAACFAHVGRNVICLDINHEKIAKLQQGVIPIFEPGLKEMVYQALQTKKISFTTNYTEALKTSSIAILAVDTPTDSHGACNLQNITNATHAIANVLEHDITVIVKSTVPVGTASHVRSILIQSLQHRNVDVNIEVVSHPEFLREGSAIHDFMHPDRLIVGVSSERGEEVIRTLYAPFNHNQEIFIMMDPASSELTKYAANTMLAARISFMNWIANLAERTGADIESIRIGLGRDHRIGPYFLKAGMGYGGSCFPKDTRALQSTAQDHQLETSFIHAVDSINERQKTLLGKKIIAYFTKHGGCADKEIAILGLAFKPNTDDMREAPSLTLIHQLLEQQMHLRLFDPTAMETAKNYLPDSPYLTWCTTPWEAIEHADALALVTEWPLFQDLDLPSIKMVMKTPIIFDGRNLFQPDQMQLHGFNYISIGRPTILQEVEPEVSFTLKTKGNPKCCGSSLLS